MLDIEETFAQLADSEFLNFDLVENKLHTRPDLHAFLLLDNLVPGTRDMVDDADHDIIYLSTDIEELAKVATIDHIRELSRCGVMFDEEAGSLAMFV